MFKDLQRLDLMPMSAGAEDLKKGGVNRPSGKCSRCLLRCRLSLRGREGLLRGWGEGFRR